MKRSFTVVFLALFSAASLFANGGQAAESSGQPAARAGASVVTAPGTFPVVTSPVTLRVFAGGAPAIENFETNEFTTFYEQKTGVHLDWIIAPPTSLQEQRRLSVASGDLPDFYMAAGFSKVDEVLYGKENVFIPLNNLIDTYGFWIKEMFKDLPDARSQITTPDGNIYGLPNGTDTLHTQYGQKLYVNMDWMKKLNLQIPNTLDEFTAVLRAFKTRDPNGNGKADEIPLISPQPPGTGVNQVIPFFANSFIQMDMDGWYVTADNKVDIVYNKPEFRQTLEYLNGLVKEGLLSPTAFSITNAELRQLAENQPDQILGSVVALAPSGFYSMTSPRQRNFDAIAPLAGPNGVRFSVYSPGTTLATGHLMITHVCKNPEVVMRWVDWFFSQEGLMTMRIGREGIEWKWAEPGELGINGEQGLWHNIGAQGGSTNAFWMQYGVAQYNRHGKQVGVSDDLLYGPEGLNTRIYRYSEESYVPYKPARYVPPMYFNAEDMEPIVQTINDVASYRVQMWARFITGDLTLNDQSWNTYLTTLDNMGIKNIVAAYQKTYETYLKNAGN